LGNSPDNFQLHRFTTSENIANSFRGATFFDSRRTCIYAVEHFILNIFACLLRRICIYFIRLFYITFQYSYFVSFYVVADKDVTVAGRARHKTRRCQWLQEKWNLTRFDLLQESCKTCTTLILVSSQLCGGCNKIKRSSFYCSLVQFYGRCADAL